MTFRLSKENFNSLRILLDSGASSYIVLGKHTQKLWKKITKPTHWSTQGDDLHTNSKSIVASVLLELNATKSIT